MTTTEHRSSGDVSDWFRADSLHVSYDRVLALKDASISLARGQVIALIGSNGAGKSTTLRAITGLAPLRSGSITFRGKRLDKMSTAKIVAEGVSMVPEGRHIYPYMNVRDNLLMGAYLRRDKAEIAADIERCVVRFPRVGERLGQQAGTLSGGEQQMVAICRALMAKPDLLLLDEPSLGLAPLLVREIAKAITELNTQENLSVILVEQNSRMALSVSSHAYVLESGSVALSGKSDDLISNDEVRRLYLGG